MTKWRYGLVLDAGSSGTRLHVYRWLNSKRARQEANDHQLQSLPVVKTKKHWTKKIKPGVSTFGDHPEDVGPDHLKALFDHALEIIPEEAVDDTPIFLLATAGVRLLEDYKRKELLKSICSYARKSTKFLLPDCDLHIQAIPGETEGLYGWVAANYLLGGFDSPKEHEHGKGHHTYGFLDMGGASAQIAFAPNVTEAEKHGNDLKLLRMRNINGAPSEYKVFVTSWLGFGVHEARRRYVEKLMEGTSDTELPDPCSPNGLTVSTKGDLLSPGKVKGKEPHLVGTGKFSECLVKTNLLLDKDAACVDPPCLFNGVHVPAIDFDVNHFVGVSEYWHTTHEIFEMGHNDKAYDFNTYQNRVEEFCTKDWTSIREGLEDHRWGKVDEATAVDVCFRASWLISVLHDGIGIPRVGLEGTPNHGHNGTKEVLDSAKEKGYTDPFQAINKIDDTEVSWTLGKMVLYAASEVPPTKTSNLPVGFGSNVAGTPADFQYAGSRHSTTSNSTQDHDSDGWRDTLFEGKTPRRVPGFLLFMLILCIAVFLLCGKDRRSRFLHRFRIPLFRGPSRRRGIFAHKPSMLSLRSSHGVHDHLLESGLAAPEDFELESVDGDNDDNEHSDSSQSSKQGKTSGWATPTFKPVSMSMGNGSSDSLGQSASKSTGHGNGNQKNAMDRRGLIVRTESRERLPGLVEDRRSRSRKASPTRHNKGTMSPLTEY